MPDLVVACALACVHSTILSILILREFVKRSPGPFFGLGACRVIKVKVPELMKAKGYNATDLMRHANIAYGTALRLSKGEAEAISFEVLESLCKLFGVRVEDVIEYVPE